MLVLRGQLFEVVVYILFRFEALCPFYEISWVREKRFGD
jgi:hypothetical protein